MCAIKAIILFQLIVIALLLTTTASGGKRIRLTSNRKTSSSHTKYTNGLFSNKSKRRKVEHLDIGNNTPTHKKIGRLYCRTGFLLEIKDNGKVVGTQNISSHHTLIEIQVFGKILRRLKGVASNRYLTLNDRGRLHSTPDYHNNLNTFFIEKYEENNWNTYSSSVQSQNCGGWRKDTGRKKEQFIAIKKNGSVKRPCKTEPGMHSTQFVTL